MSPPSPQCLRAIRDVDVFALDRLSWRLADLLEQDRSVAAFAPAPECAAMRLVLPVAGIAIRGQCDLRDVPGDVAGLAIESAVRPGQGVARLRAVVEAPSRPTIRVVAKPAVRRETPFMMLVLVASGASQRRAFEHQRTMAFLTGHDGVAPNQGKSRDVVIERHDAAPVRLAVALLAPVAEFALVRVIFSMTRHAGRRQLVAIEIAYMTGIAFDLGVRRPQRELGRLIVVEMDRGPLPLVVAAVALRSVPSAVHIFDSVAVRTCRPEVLVAFVHMACGAGNGAMGLPEQEFGLLVVERFHAVPCRLGMTIVACFTQAAFVRIRRLVTVETAPGCVAELRRLGVTGGARHRRMCVPERKICKCVIEGLAVQLDDIGVSPNVIRVTMGAFLLRCTRITPVETLAGLTVGARLLVARQAELSLRPV